MKVNNYKNIRKEIYRALTFVFPWDLKDPSVVIADDVSAKYYRDHPEELKIIEEHGIINNQAQYIALPEPLHILDTVYYIVVSPSGVAFYRYARTHFIPSYFYDFTDYPNKISLVADISKRITKILIDHGISVY